ncbi:pilus assembly FimT family protein [Acinetobacter dispersus]|uniref:pilus assembly FimT family protein n=1 Tax=Acinetobacter dispersus TaxID=70348 RepID=UPI003C2D55E3
MGKTRGFTLIELLVTIAVLAIITSMSMPLFQDMMVAQNFRKSTQELILTLNQARSKAVLERRQVEVLLQPNSTQPSRANTDNQLNWMPNGKSVLKTNLPTSIYFNLTGGLCTLDGSTPPKCVTTNNDTNIEICNTTTGSDKKSKIVSISRMGTIQQTAEGTC